MKFWKSNRANFDAIRQTVASSFQVHLNSCPLRPCVGHNGLSSRWPRGHVGRWHEDGSRHGAVRRLVPRTVDSRGVALGVGWAHVRRVDCDVALWYNKSAVIVEVRLNEMFPFH